MVNRQTRMLAGLNENAPIDQHMLQSAINMLYAPNVIVGTQEMVKESADLIKVTFVYLRSFPILFYIVCFWVFCGR